MGAARQRTICSGRWPAPGGRFSIEADLGATVIEDRFAAALADAERFLGIPPARRPPVEGSSDGGDGETPGAP